jgi:hypothetical protein
MLALTSSLIYTLKTKMNLRSLSIIMIWNYKPVDHPSIKCYEKSTLFQAHLGISERNSSKEEG